MSKKKRIKRLRRLAKKKDELLEFAWKLAGENTVKNAQGLTIIPKGDEWEYENWNIDLSEKQDDNTFGTKRKIFL